MIRFFIKISYKNEKVKEYKINQLMSTPRKAYFWITAKKDEKPEVFDFLYKIVDENKEQELTHRAALKSKEIFEKNGALEYFRFWHLTLGKKFDKKEMKQFREDAQIVFQDPYSSLNPRLTLYETISEPLLNSPTYKGNKKKIDARVRELMDTVGLSQRLIGSYPHELDGGRRQRIGIARALAVKPKFIVLDEPVSALDVCIQAQVINLLKRLQKEMQLKQHTNLILMDISGNIPTPLLNAVAWM